MSLDLRLKEHTSLLSKAKDGSKKNDSNHNDTMSWRKYYNILNYTIPFLPSGKKKIFSMTYGP